MAQNLDKTEFGRARRLQDGMRYSMRVFWSYVGCELACSTDSPGCVSILSYSNKIVDPPSFGWYGLKIDDGGGSTMQEQQH